MVNLIPWDHPARSRSPSHPQQREVHPPKSNTVVCGSAAPIPEGSIKSVLIHLIQLLSNPSRQAIDVRKDLKLLRDRTINANKQHAIANALPSSAVAANRGGSVGRNQNEAPSRYQISERESASVLYMLLSSMCFVQESAPKFHESPLEQQIQKLLQHSKNGDRRQFHEAVEEVVQHLLLFTPMHPPVVLDQDEIHNSTVVPLQKQDESVVFFSPDASPKRTRLGSTSSFTRHAASNGRSVDRPPNLPMPRPERRDATPPRAANASNFAVVVEAGDPESKRNGALDFCADFLQMHNGRPAVNPQIWKLWIDTIEQYYVAWAEEYALSTGRRGSTSNLGRSAASNRLSRSGSLSRSDSKKFAADGEEFAGLSNSAVGAGGRQRSATRTAGGDHPIFVDEPETLSRAPRLHLRPYWQNPTNLYAQFCTFLLVIFFTKGMNRENYEARLLKLTQYFHFHFNVHQCTDPIPLMPVEQKETEEPQQSHNNNNNNSSSASASVLLSDYDPRRGSMNSAHIDPTPAMQPQKRDRGFSATRKSGSSMRLSTHVNTGSSSVFIFQTPEVLRSSGHLPQATSEGDANNGRKTLWATQPQDRSSLHQSSSVKVAGPPIKVRAMVPSGLKLSGGDSVRA